MIIKKTDAANQDFVRLVKMLDQYYYDRFGETALKYRDENSIEDLVCAFLAYEDDVAIGCAGIKLMSDSDIEIKRVFVLDSHRRKGCAKALVKACESEGKRLGFSFAALETGASMSDAIGLYQDMGYEFIDNYGFFENDEDCVCMKKEL